MLTPRALRHIEFRKVFRGYDPQEVDEFLGRLIEEYERLRERVERGAEPGRERAPELAREDRKSTRLNSSHVKISYAVFCLKKKKKKNKQRVIGQTHVSRRGRW